MRTNIRIFLFLSMAVVFLCLYGCRLRRVSSPNPGYLPSAEMRYYEEVGEEEGVDWNQVIPVFHYWRKITSDDYYFDIPSDEQVGKWQNLCEERNQTDSTSRFYVQGCYANMNQYVTVLDFIELWYRDESLLEDDDLTTWRLLQYDPDAFFPPDSEFDKFYVIKNVIQGLLLYKTQSQWELNCHASLEEDFQEYYDRILVREAVRHSDDSLAAALKREQEAWLGYHAAVDSAFRIINGDPHGMVGSAWPMAIGGILCDDARIRSFSLEDFYFALTDSLDYQFAHKRSMIGEYVVEKHARVSETDVLREYGKFSAFFRDKDFFEPEFSYPLPVLRSALDKEKSAWILWMASRHKVSSLLEGLCKETYDNATNNVRRRKLVMLKNRYQGYGLVSGDILDCILSYDCPDPEIVGFSFERNWSNLE
jgi:hypothetical protein